MVSSVDRGDRKLLADLSSQAIVDFTVTGDRSFRTIGQIGVNRVAATFAISSCLFKLAKSQRGLSAVRVQRGRHRQQHPG